MTTTSREANWTKWMRAAVAGDSGAYRQFLHAVAPYIRAIARSRCRRLGILESEAEDIVQEVLLTIHLKQGTWDHSREIGPWITAIELRPRDIDALVGKLTCHQQEIVRSISIGAASIRETAERLEMTEVAVRVSLHRALKALGALYRRSAGED